MFTKASQATGEKKQNVKNYFFSFYRLFISKNKLMKFFIVFFIQIVLSLQIVSAQQITRASSDSIKNDYHYYMKKRNTYNTVGWVCLGTGLGLGVIGLGEASEAANRLSGSNTNLTQKAHAVCFSE